MIAPSEVQALVLSPLIELFELDYGLDVLRFCTHKTTKNTAVFWKGVEYTRYPVRVEGFNKNIQGRMPRPKFTVGNIGGGISELLIAFDNFSGAKVTRIRTLGKFLDAVNFPGNVNPTADPTAEFPRDVWYVDMKSFEDNEYVQFELSSPFDIPSMMLPARQMLPICTSIYRGPECGYAGGPVATERDVPTTNPALDRCSKQLSGCNLRFGVGNELPFSGEPSIGLSRI